MDSTQPQPRSKRRKRYLEPGSHYVVPRSTSLYQKAAEAQSASQPRSSKNIPQSLAGGSGVAAFDTRSLSDAHGDSDENPDPDDTYGFEQSSLSSDSDQTADSARDDASMSDPRSLSDAHGDSDENPDPDDTYGFEESSLSSDSDQTADSARDDAGLSDTDREQDEDEFCRLFSDERLPNSDLNVREAMIILMAYSTSAGLNWTNMEKLVGGDKPFFGKANSASFQAPAQKNMEIVAGWHRQAPLLL
ncbi:hypothetical protein MTO96_046799 [Rhipicephalus appendiculatus]